MEINARRTSIETYHAIKEEGLLSKLRFQVYDIIYKNQPITISEIIRRASREVTNTGSFTGRISELERMGVIESAYEGDCPITGRNVNFWVTTNELPKKLEKEKTKTEIIKELIEDRDYWKSECLKVRKELEEAQDIMLENHEAETQRSLF
jgi:predicted transcriptional regulator